jgi:hypothetical protein
MGFFLIWMLVGTKRVLSVARTCFGVNDGVEHAGMQYSYCVSMSGLHKGQEICHVSRDIVTLAHFFIPHSHFIPKIGEMVEFSDAFFLRLVSG